MLIACGCTSRTEQTQTQTHLTKEQAITLAIKPLSERYKDSYHKFMPYDAKFVNGTWHVFGTLPEDQLGCTPEAYIDDSSGTVIRITHGR